MRSQLVLPFSDDELYDSRWEYLLIASPGRKVTTKIREVKEDFYATHRQKIAIDTWPHITIAFFRAKQKLEGLLIEMMQKVCSRQQKFIADLKDFDGFDHSTIYIKVQDWQPFLQLAADLSPIDDFLINNGCRSAHLVDTPHLSIARRLPYSVYIKAKQEYSHRRFQDSFIVNELLLLKRRHEEHKCKRVTTLHFSSPNYFLN
jgi:2'-5' RNA ligase